MNKNDCFFIGYFSKAIGNKGELSLKLDVDQPTQYKNLELLFIQINKRDHQLVPFSIESISIQQNGQARIKLSETPDDTASAKSYVGKSAFLPLEMLPVLGGNQFYFHEVIGFRAIDHLKGEIGKISEVLDYPGQAILQIEHNSGKEILIPITDENVKGVDRNQKLLHVNAPEGLIDLYLES